MLMRSFNYCLIHHSSCMFVCVCARAWWDQRVGERQRTSLDCLMLRRGIHKVPTMVSQISPLFHTSTVRPRSRRFISLGGADGGSGRN